MKAPSIPPRYRLLGALIRSTACAVADACLQLAADQSDRTNNRLLRESAAYLMVLTVAHLCAKKAGLNGNSPAATLEGLRERILFGKGPDEVPLSRFAQFITAVGDDEYIVDYANGDLKALGLTASDLDLFATRGLPTPEDTQPAKAFWGFVTRPCRLEYLHPSSQVPPADTTESFAFGDQ